MARVGTQQAAFSGGEISPRLYGRTDVAVYGVSAEAIENWIVRPEGGLMRRHGSRFAGEVNTHAKRPRLCRFVFSNAQAYMLVFEDQLIRIYKNGAPITQTAQNITGITQANPAVVTYSGSDTYANGDRVLITGVVGMTQVNNREFTVANVNTGANTFELSGVNSSGYDAYSSGGTVAEIYTVATTYLEADLPSLYFAQSGDVLYIAHPAYAPRTLSRSGDTSWTLATTALDKGPFAALNTNDAARVYCVASSYDVGDSISIVSNTAMFSASHVGSYFRMQEIYFDQLAVGQWEPDKAPNSVGSQVAYNGNVYRLVDSGAGAQTGTIPPTHTFGEAYDGMNESTNDYKKWRYLHSRWAIVLITAFTDSKNVTATVVTYLCNGLNPASKTITNATNASGLIRITSNAHGYSDGDYVHIASVGGVTAANGDWQIKNVATNTFDLVGSTFSGTYTSGGTAKRFTTWLWQFGAFSAARGYPACVALHEQRLIYANTTSDPTTLWASKTGDYPNFYPGTADDASITYNIAAGRADPIRWLESGQDLLVGTLNQEFAGYGGGLGDPITPSNTRIVPQSGEGAAYIQPVKIGSNDILFVNRAARKIFSYGLKGDQQTPYGATDILELAEHLTVGKTIVRAVWAKNPVSLLWVLFSDGTIAAATYRPDQKVLAWHRHPVDGFVESIDAIPSDDGTTDRLWLVVKRTINGGTKRYVEYLADPFEPADEDDKDLMGFVDSALRYNGSPTTTLTGLYHLEGEEVEVVGDGSYLGAETVTNGKITLDDAVENAWVGLAYTSRLRMLRPEGAAVGTAQGKTKRTPRVSVLVHNAIGGTIGPASEATMDALVTREQDDPMDVSPPMRSRFYDAYIASDFDLDGRIAILQEEPMPLDILSIAPLQSVTEP